MATVKPKAGVETYEIRLDEVVTSLLDSQGGVPPELLEKGIRQIRVDVSPFGEAAWRCDSPWFMLLKYAKLANEYGKKVVICNLRGSPGEGDFYHFRYTRIFKDMGVQYAGTD